MNWHHRHCWLRDASFTLGASMDAGFTEEGTAWRDWLPRAVGGAPEEAQVVCRLDGGRHLDDYAMDELPGYRDARPGAWDEVRGARHGRVRVPSAPAVLAGPRGRPWRWPRGT